MLKVLSMDSSNWITETKEHREKFDKYRNEFAISKPSTGKSHPLDKNTSSPWSQYYKSLDQFQSINQDVVRLRSQPIHELNENDKKILCDILYIYSKLNPELGYQQGMHEILYPIYCIVLKDSEVSDVSIPLSLQEDEKIEFQKVQELCSKNYVMHDSFIIFDYIMKSASVYFEHSNDPAKGIKARCGDLFEILQKFDFELFIRFKDLQIEPQLFAIRWLKCIFVQDIPVDFLVYVWDNIFGFSSFLSLIPHICIGILEMKKEKIMRAADSSQCFMILMATPVIQSMNEVNDLISSAYTSAQPSMNRKIVSKTSQNFVNPHVEPAPRQVQSPPLTIHGPPEPPLVPIPRPKPVGTTTPERNSLRPVQVNGPPNHRASEPILKREGTPQMNASSTSQQSGNYRTTVESNKERQANGEFDKKQSLLDIILRLDEKVKNLMMREREDKQVINNIAESVAELKNYYYGMIGIL